ncbi:DUF6541 family protein [Pseudonocardia acidicola]|uniref:Uncharacterized protein n=1 Tax=Pseudonocardia acidicola TaxID=2724939 RepID=A0ABX1SJ12_9PSEU|nr:DUF6541 family protein [Pseudonocardia acidicola]NMI01547.1 hypothetical protein [Pseudonocardia acidicola]
MPELAPGAVLVVYGALLFAPGLVVGMGFGLRGWLLAAAAPLLGYGIVGAAGSALPHAGVNWSPMAFVTSAAVVALLAALVRFAARRIRPSSGRPRSAEHWPVTQNLGIAAMVAVSAGVGLIVTASATDGFTAVSQIWDSVFHSNAIRFIADTGLSDPAALQKLNNPTTSSYYYPNAYHVLAATVVMLTGSSVPTVVDTGVGLVPGILALGMVALIRHCGARPALAAAAALLSCAFTAFPYDLLPWGSLLPYIAALALLPAFLALWVATLNDHGGRTTSLPVTLGIAGIGLLALHPSVAVAAAVLGLAFVVQLWISRRPRLHDFRAVGITALAAVALGAPLLAASLAAAAGPAFNWPANMRPADAMGQLFFLSHEQPFPQYWLVGLAAVGVFQVRNLLPLRWFVAAGLVFAALFVMAAAYEGELVALLTRPWWDDKWRFAALWSLAALLLASAGVVGLRDALWSFGARLVPALKGLGGRPRTAVSSAALTLVLLITALLTNGLYNGRNEARLAQAFTNGPTVNANERLAFDTLARIAPAGSTVMNDPYDGSALMWALDDVRPVFASPVIAAQELPTMDPHRRTLFYSFNQLDADLAVQRAVRALNIRYVIICTGFIPPSSQHVPGMQGLDAVRSLELVYENADARIYAIRPAASPGGRS